jgi:hypothetical protein
LATYTPRGPDDGHDDELKDGIQIDGELGNLLADMRNVNKQPIRDIQWHGLVHLFTRSTSATNCFSNIQSDWPTLHWNGGLVLTGTSGRVWIGIGGGIH